MKMGLIVMISLMTSSLIVKMLGSTKYFFSFNYWLIALAILLLINIL